MYDFTNYKSISSLRIKELVTQVSLFAWQRERVPFDLNKIKKINRLTRLAGNKRSLEPSSHNKNISLGKRNAKNQDSIFRRLHASVAF